MKLGLSLLVAASLLVPYAVAAPRSESQEYIALGGDNIADCGANIGFNLGGVCFYPEGDESSVTITVADDSGLPTGFYYEWRVGATLIDGANGAACASATLEAVPDATELRIWIDQALTVIDCGVGGGPGTTGVVTADWA